MAPHFIVVRIRAFPGWVENAKSNKAGYVTLFVDMLKSCSEPAQKCSLYAVSRG